MSIGGGMLTHNLISQLSSTNFLNPNNTQEINEQMKMWQELEKQKRENESLIHQIEQIEREKKSSFVDRENYIALKEELEMLKEEIVIKEEDLSKYQRHCISIADELQFYKDQNNDLLRKLDDVERTITSDNENASVIIYHEAQMQILQFFNTQ